MVWLHQPSLLISRMPPLACTAFSVSQICSVPLDNFPRITFLGNLTSRNTALRFGNQLASLVVRRVGMLNLNMDDVGEAAIVECEGTLIGGDEALPATRCGHGAGSPRPLKKEGNPMRGSLLHLSSILWVSLLVLSTDVLWAQRTSTLEESAVQLPDAPSRVATVSEAQTRLHLTYKGLP